MLLFCSEKYYGYLFAALVFCFIDINDIAAQDNKRESFKVINTEYHKQKTSFVPKAILVQLRSEQRRIDYFLEISEPYEATQVRKEAGIVRKMMKNDFEDHFTFCPVYYFMDTNAVLIKEQRFEDVLCTAEGLPIKNCIIHPGDTDYYIVYYGYPEEQMQMNAVENTDFNIGNGEVMGKGLIFLNYQYRQKDFYYRFGYWDFFHKLNPRYEFRSAKYDIDYFPFAAKYEQDLQETFNNAVIANKQLSRY